MYEFLMDSNRSLPLYMHTYIHKHTHTYTVKENEHTVKEPQTGDLCISVANGKVFEFLLLTHGIILLIPVQYSIPSSPFDLTTDPSTDTGLTFI